MSHPQPTGNIRQSYRSATLIASLSVLAVILLLGLWVMARPESSTPQPGDPGVPADAGQVDVPTGFGAPTSDIFGRKLETPLTPAGSFLEQTGTASSNDDWSAPPAGLVWQNVYGAPLPFSTSDGPTGITDTGVPVGFAHTPQGCVMAMLHAGMRIITAPGNQPQALAAAMHIAQTDASRQVLDQKINARISADKAHRWFGIPVGIKVTAYTDDYCQVRIASGKIGGQPTESTNDVVWRDGSWKVVVPDSGVPASQRKISSLAGWNTQW